MQTITKFRAREQGLRRYFLGHACGNGHVAEHNMDDVCVLCEQNNKVSKVVKLSQKEQ